MWAYHEDVSVCTSWVREQRPSECREEVTGNRPIDKNRVYGWWEWKVVFSEIYAIINFTEVKHEL